MHKRKWFTFAAATLAVLTVPVGAQPVLAHPVPAQPVLAQPVPGRPDIARPVLAQPADGHPVEARVATYNVFMLAGSLYPNWGQHTRAELIASEGVLADQDVAILQEAFDNDASETLLDGIADPLSEHTPVLGRSRDGWDATEGHYGDATPEDGGVAIASRWPITHRTQYVYQDGCGADAMSNKGFAHATIDSPTGVLHVFGTHLQADDPGCHDRAPQVRAAQLHELADFIAAQDLPAEDTVLVGGDLNIDADTEEFTAALDVLDAEDPARSGEPKSYDPTTNSIAAVDSPDSPPQRLDHVLAVRGHPVPENWTNEAVAWHSPEWEVGDEEKYTDFSDHYPVFAHS